MARAQGFNKVAVSGFFDVLERIFDATTFPASRVYNVDETGILTVPTKTSKVLSLRGKRQVGCISSAERGVLSTACICKSATGNFIPPMLIFPRARLTEQLKRGAPPETKFSCNKIGWMTVDDFSAWFDHFLKHARPTKENPVLLLLDGHASHTKNLEFLEKAKRSHVTVVSLPPHCSHNLQPLDVSFMGPLKTNLSQASEQFLKKYPGKVITLNELSELFGKAYLRSTSASVAVNGFRKTGIAPFNRYVFTDDDFAPADVSDIPLTVNGDGSSSNENQSRGGNNHPSPIVSNSIVAAGERNVHQMDNTVESSNHTIQSDDEDDEPFLGFDDVGGIPQIDISASEARKSPPKQSSALNKSFSVGPCDIRPIPKTAL
nr:tigger transposable element-derived protein 6-like [Aedes albopictus]